ncbi:MAG: NAD(P)H-binding protein, partial [Aliifodinibius sp.]|nr:NAD(P)H-binding protein [Candidatus Saccharibacteria bacterium]NIS47398.1 NAD(P)H-binding protein [candidate division Zixibacteria bacterium]NIV14070.1 NAD(P)H-binding protein [Fodinibius sp.]
MEKRMKVLVIGATGFVGGHIAKQAVDQNWEVVGLRRTPTKTGHLNESMITWKSGNLYDRDSLIDAMAGIDVVFHAGAFYPGKNSPH